MSGPIDGTAIEFLISSGVKHFERIPLNRGLVSSLQVVWKDATSAFSAPKFYVSNDADPPIPADDGSPDLEHWFEDTGLSVSAVSASAAGSELIDLADKGAKWLLVEISANADCDLALKPHAKE